ncbi:MAG: hypothetical protein RLY43_1439 [Bacteroidota bacterium]|jgi:hypothetical protein
MKLTNEAIKSIIDFNADETKWIQNFPEDQRSQIEEVIQNDYYESKEIEKLKHIYYKSDYYKKLEDFKKEISEAEPNFVKEARIEYLKNKIIMLENEIKKIYSDYEKAGREGIVFWLRQAFYKLSPIKQYERELKSCKFNLNVINNNNFKKEIDDYMILKAKDYPINNLVEVNKNHFAKCIWHDDNKPSMYVKNNYAYCFSCGKSGDVIDIAMKIRGMNFIEAVKFLTSNY